MASVNQIRCPYCENLFPRTTKQINAAVRRSGRWACLSCVTTKRNKASAKAIGATRTHKQSGYIEEKTQDGWRRQHIVVMEASIGRRLSAGEAVHHLNEVKTDNRLSNLRLMTHGEHTALHHIGVKRTPEQSKRIANAIRNSCRTVLSVDSANWIREQRAQGVTQKHMAKMLSVSPMTVSRVVNNKTWR